MGQSEEASRILEELIAMDPSDEEAYARLVSIYEEEKDTVSLTNLVEGMTDERIRDIYQDYMPVEVKHPGRLAPMKSGRRWSCIPTAARCAVFIIRRTGPIP